MSPVASRSSCLIALLAVVTVVSLTCRVGSMFGQAAPNTEPAPGTTPPAEASLVTIAEPHMLVVSIDGLRPDCLLRAEAPNLRSLMARGSFTMYARTTDIAVTTPSHMSMLTGVTPERHGITFNGDPPEDARVLVPTIFELAHDRGLSTAMSSGKRKFSLFLSTKRVDWSYIPTEPVGPDAEVGSKAAELISSHKPRMMLVHFPGADVSGHGVGWGTPEQLAAIEKIDQALGVVLRAIDDAGLKDSTYIIVSADHGGSVRTHGRGDVRSRYIPWIFVGPGVRANYDLTRLGRDYDIATYDTFATACYVLGIPLPPDSDGKPIKPAFDAFDLLTVTPTPKPTATPAATE